MPYKSALDAEQSLSAAAREDGSLSSSDRKAIDFAVSQIPQTSYLSSEDGLNLVNEAQKKIAGATPQQPTGETTPTSGGTEEKTQQSGGLSLEDVLSVTKDLTGWTQNADGTYTPTADALKNLGINKDETQLDDANRALSKAKAERDSAVLKLKNFNVEGDPALKGIVTGITSAWDSRIAEMDRINRSRSAAMRTTGVRLGSRWTGGDGGVMGSIISEEERQGVERISELEGKKQAAIADAKQAYENGKWNRYYQLAGLAEKAYQEQLETVKSLNEAQAKQDAELRKQQLTTIKNDSIYNAIVSAGGKTDPMHIYQAVRSQGIDVTMDDVDKFWDAVKPSTDGLYKFSNSQIGQMLARGYSADMIQSIQEDLNDGGDDAVLGGLPSGEQAWIKGILGNVGTGGAGGTLTRSEARELFRGTAYPELALSLAGMSESTILGNLQSAAPPRWFINGIETQDAMNYLPEVMQAKWDTFRTATIQGYFAKSGSGGDDIFGGSGATPLSFPEDEN